MSHHEVTFKSLATVIEVDGAHTSLVTIIFTSPDSKLGSGKSFQGTGRSQTEALRNAHEQIYKALEGK
jgi:hypothetical protein